LTIQRPGLAAALAVLFLALHLPFLPASLEDLDSINFALGVRHFDVARHQPHPPGYPVYIAAAKLAHAVEPDETKVLGLVSNVAGALGVWSLIVLFTRIDVTWPRPWAVLAAVVAATCPLYWLTAARPLSDVPGLAAAVAIQALLLAVSSGAGIVAASFVTAVAIGIRSQIAWLTVPLLVLAILRHRAPGGTTVVAGAMAAFVAGCAVWAVPLVAMTGGPTAYWRALFAQGAEDLTGIEMLWTTPTPRELLRALYFAFVAPWAVWPMAVAVVPFAAAGVVTMYRSARASLWVLALAFGPYLVFDVLFQETFTSRYALPLVPPIAYLAVRAVATLPRTSALIVAFTTVGLAATIGVVSARQYSAAEAPAFRILREMRAAGIHGQPALAPVLAMHRREDLDLRRPLQWAGADAPAFSRRLAAPPKHEWLELVKYWNADRRAPVWFVADPQRTDLALIDGSIGRHGVYRWPLAYPVLIGGVRPNEMDWYVFESPGWYLGEGWALTPETAGVAEEDHRGPGVAPIEGWIRRRREAVTLMIGGRNLGADARPAAVSVTIDGRPIDQLSVAPGFFLRFVQVPEDGLAGSGQYARLAIAAGAVADGQPRVAVEQFDAQSANRVVFGFGDGWHEMEYNPATGRSWRWMSEHGVIRVRAQGRALRLDVAGDAEGFSRPTTVSVRIGTRAIGRWTVRNRFEVQAPIPAAALADGETAIDIESDQFAVPAERSRRTQDRRHLALKVDELKLTPVF
jgi:hypothetical protein